MFNKTRFLVLLLTMFLAACGGSSGGSKGGDNGGNDGGNGGGNDGGNNGGNDDDPLIGVFVDSAVAGIGYETESRDETTNENGEFEYLEGEIVIFKIGDVELPPVTAGEVITPLDIFDTDDFIDQRVINLARLLQSLDSDGDPGNGITLTSAAHLAATGITIDFDVPTETFEQNADVINMVSNGGGDGTLVSADAALAHVQQGSSLVGSWQVASADEYLAITFMADGTYLIAEGTESGEPEDDGGKPGIEYGTYSWHPVTGKISVNVLIDTNGTWGLSSARDDLTIKRSGDTIVARETMDDGSVDEATFTRVTSADNALIGGWVVRNETDIAVLVFNGTHYSWAETGTGPNGATEGAEFGSYTWSPATFAFDPTIEVDDNGDDAFSGEPSPMKMVVNGDTLTMVFDGVPGGTLKRVGAATLPTPSVESLVGTWTFEGEYLAATFMADGTYMIAEAGPAEGGGFSGVEYGTYDWNSSTGALKANPGVDTNGSWGLSSAWPDLRAVVNPENLVTLTETTDEGIDVAELSRVRSAENPLIGSWMLKEGETVLVLTFTSSHYAWAEIGPQTEGGSNGPEFGTYDWNLMTGAFVATQEEDHNGDWGFSGEGGSVQITLDGDELTLVFQESDGATLTRVK